MDSCLPLCTCTEVILNVCVYTPQPSVWTNFVNITSGQYALGTYIATVIAVTYHIL